MLIVKSENTVWIDVDDTLVMWPQNPFVRQYVGPETRDPFDLRFLPFDNYGSTVWLRPNEKNIKLLKSYKQRGYFVIVHSANGWAWAEDVVKKLMLSESVDMIMTKPAKYVDDLPADGWMMRVYLKDEE